MKTARTRRLIQTFLFWPCLFLLSTAVAAKAPDIECPKLERQIPQTDVAVYSQALLWRVESSDGLVNYLFGTIHLSDPRVSFLNNGVKSALLESNQFVMEVMLNGESVSAMSSAMTLPKGETLEMMSDSHTYERARSLLQRHGLSALKTKQLKPWAAYTILSLPPGHFGVPLDMRLMMFAREHHLQISGLEEIEEQIALFDSMRNSEQVELLKHTLCNYELVQSDIEEIVGHYIKHDLNAMLQMAHRYRYPGSETFIEALLWRRNKIMAERMQAYLRRGSAFVAVGALHLPGRGGILDLLAKAGYTVTPIE